MAGTVKFSVDCGFFVGVQHFLVPGETVLIPLGYAMVPGGKEANRACTIRLLKGAFSMIGRVGHDFLGQMLKDDLRQANVRMDTIVEDENHTTRTALSRLPTLSEMALLWRPGPTISSVLTRCSHNRIICGYN